MLIKLVRLNGITMKHRFGHIFSISTGGDTKEANRVYNLLGSKSQKEKEKERKN